MSSKKLIITITVILIAVIALTITITALHRENNTPTTTTTTEPTTLEPYILLSEIKHEFYKKEIIGRIYSEDLGIDCNLVWGTSDDCLRIGAGLHTTTSLPGRPTPPIIGGHVQTVFKGFENAEKGKTITISMPYGDYVYEIVDMEVMNKNDFDFSVKNEPTGQAIFYTCYPFGKVNYVKTERLFLYCDFIEGVKVLDDINFNVEGLTTSGTPGNKMPTRADTKTNSK